jgi:hypothetical protein
MSQRANYHPHSRKNKSRKNKSRKNESRKNKSRKNESRPRRQPPWQKTPSCHHCDPGGFYAKHKQVVEETFDTQLKEPMQKQKKLICTKGRSVVVQVERPGSGVVVCHVKLRVDTCDIYRQLATQVTSKLNEPYVGRHKSPSRAWEAWDFELFAGHNFDDKDLISEDNEKARFQVCCLAFCDIPVVMCRKKSAVWVDVQVRDGQKVRTVSNVRPVTREHIIRACFPDVPQEYFQHDFVSDVNFKVTFDGETTPPGPPWSYGFNLCDASCSVVVDRTKVQVQVVRMQVQTPVMRVPTPVMQAQARRVQVQVLRMQLF